MTTHIEARQSVPALESVARSRILDSAAELILDQGFAGTSMREVAASVGIKAGSLYHHFASKEEIFSAILERGIEVMVDSFAAVPVAVTEPPEALLRAHVRAHLGSLFEFGPYTAVHVTTFRSAPSSVREAIVPRRDAYEAMWSTLLHRIASGGAFRDDQDLGIARLVLFGAMNSTIEWFDLDGSLAIDDLADAVATQFWQGVSREGPSKEGLSREAAIQ